METRRLVPKFCGRKEIAERNLCEVFHYEREPHVNGDRCYLAYIFVIRSFIIIN